MSCCAVGTCADHRLEAVVEDRRHVEFAGVEAWADDIGGDLVCALAIAKAADIGAGPHGR
jgi:hypothetical protein